MQPPRIQTSNCVSPHSKPIHILYLELHGGLGCDQTIDFPTEKDDSDAIDQSNIIGGRTRGAKPQGGYADPDESDLPLPKDQQ